ncbi:MAG TPA: CAP domain-containing protein [Mycobacteriales bacterium]|jgi:uncharacterized protein YkwD|nr:CAP domain-containing protein [Mycobacteriales bacterium]
MFAEDPRPTPSRRGSPWTAVRRRRKGPVMITVTLLALGALGVATPALLPSADAASMDTSIEAVTAQTPPLLIEITPPARPAPSPPRPARSPSPTPPASRAPEPPAVELPIPVETGGPVEKEPAPPSDGRPAADLAMEKRVLALVNQRRAAVGCVALRSNYRLVRAAYAHSKDMAAEDYFSHTGADGSTPWLRARRAGYTQANAENLAAGQTTAEEVVTAWMASAEHKKNLLDCDSRAMGVALAHGGSYRIYWTQMFGTA